LQGLYQPIARALGVARNRPGAGSPDQFRNGGGDVRIQCEPRSVASEIVGVDGTELLVRQVEITDVDRLERMFARLSAASIRFRFFSPLHRLPQSALLRFADVDHCRREALVALDGDEIVSVARYDELAAADGSESRDAELAVTVEDAWHHHGIGSLLTRRLGALASERGFHTFVARILPDNRAALGLVRKLVPDARVAFAGGDYEARLPLAWGHRHL
jgi:GNAT superfamily N-acetyltransferase